MDKYEKCRLKSIKNIEERLNIDNLKDYLYDLYINNKKTTREIAEIVYGKKNSFSSINRWLHYYNIPIRHGSEAIKTQYIGDKGTKRKEFAINNAKTVLQTKENREKLRQAMQTEGYKEKQRLVHLGDKNGMYGKYGEEHPNWNPDKTHEQRIKDRKLQKNKDFIKAVLTRDNYTCQCCGDNKGHNLVVHHLDGYNWCEEKRFDENNGITLCETCHKNFHHIYGYGNNTKEQYEEWLQQNLNGSED